MTLVFVLVAYRLDLVIGTNYIRDAVIIAFIANETISLVENAGLMGLPLPEVISKAIDILQKNTGSASIPYKSRKLRFLRLRLKLYSLYILIFTKFYTIIKY